MQRELKYAVQVAGSSGAAVVRMTAPYYDTGEQPDGQPWPEDPQTRLDTYNGIARRVATSIPSTSLLNLIAMACPEGSTRSPWTASRFASPTASTSRSPGETSSRPRSGRSS